MRYLVIGALIVSAVAFALTKGTVVYVKARNTRVFSKPDANSSAVATLQPGTEVKWQQGPVNKEFHAIESSDGSGYVYFTSLTTKKPQEEYEQGQGNTPIPPAAFATSGAATKALGEGAVEYGDKKLNKPDAVKAVLAMEAMGAQTSDEKVSTYVHSVGLTPATGAVGGAR